jgi:large subunit ribosomal protein L19
MAGIETTHLRWQCDFCHLHFRHYVKIVRRISAKRCLAENDSRRAPFAKERLEHGRTFVVTNSAGQLAAVIELRMLEELEQAAAGAVFRGGTAEDDAPHADMDEGAGAHGARFLRHVEIAVGEAPVAEDALGLGDGEHLGVGRRVLERLDLIASARDDAAFVNDDGADRHFLLLPSTMGLAQGFAHEVLITVKVDKVVHNARAENWVALPANQAITPVPFPTIPPDFAMPNLIDKINKEQLKKDLKPFSVGDSVRVHTIVKEGDKERVQIFTGIVIGRKGRDINETFTVRRISYGEGVERVFPLHSPRIAKVEIETAGVARRAKLNYLRQRSGKAAMAVREKTASA